MSTIPTETVLDVRTLTGPRRHPLIVATFEALVPGHSMQIVNDHDPAPLRQYFESRLEDRFSWDYVERGPKVWRVALGKPSIARDQAAGCCGGACGGQ